MKYPFIFSMLLIFATGLVHAEAVYKCKTTQGKMRYQKTPCAENTQEIGSWVPKTKVKKTDDEKSKPEKKPPIVIKQRQDGHYFVPAEVNSHNVMFMVDTGATIVTIPRSIANATNTVCSEEVLFRTAAGNVKECTGKITEFKIGEFVFKNIEVGISSKSNQALLGMNVLRNFNIEQKDGEMRLSEHEPDKK